MSVIKIRKQNHFTKCIDTGPENSVARTPRARIFSCWASVDYGPVRESASLR